MLHNYSRQSSTTPDKLCKAKYNASEAKGKPCAPQDDDSTWWCKDVLEEIE
jgi:hypothetical protein